MTQSPSLRPAASQVITALLAAVLAMVPLIEPEGWRPHDFQRCLQIICMLVVGVGWAMSMARRRPSHRPPLPHALFIAWLSLAVMSACRAEHWQAAFQELSLLIGSLLVVDAVRQRQILKAEEWLGRGAVIGAGLYAGALFVLFAAAVASTSTLYLNALVPGFDNYRFLNHAQTVILPFVAVVTASDPAARWRRSAWFVLVLQLALLALTRGRATAFGLTTAALIAAFWIRSAGAASLARSLGGSAIVGISVYGAVYLAVPHLLGVTWGESAGSMADLGSGRERLILWQAALAAIWESPWLGIGPMHFAGLHLPMGAHPHNVYLQWVAEYGLPAGLMMSAALVWLLYRSARRLRNDASVPVLATGAWIACMAAATEGLLSGNFVMPLSQCWIAVALGLLLRLTGWSDMQAARPHRFATIAVTSTFIVGLAACSAVDAAKTPPHVGQVLWVPDTGMRTNPRFWLNGRI